MLGKKIIECDGYIAIYYNNRELSADCFSWGKFYEEIGLTEFFKKYPERASVQNVLAGENEIRRVKDTILRRYEYLNLGKDRKGNIKIKKYRVRKKKLTSLDFMSLGMDYLNWSPSVYDKLPTGVIIFALKDNIVVDLDKIWENMDY